MVGNTGRTRKGQMKKNNKPEEEKLWRIEFQYNMEVEGIDEDETLRQAVLEFRKDISNRILSIMKMITLIEPIN